MKGFVYYKIMDSKGFTYGVAYDFETANTYAATLEEKYKRPFHTKKREVKSKLVNEQLSLF